MSSISYSWFQAFKLSLQALFQEHLLKIQFILTWIESSSWSQTFRAEPGVTLIALACFLWAIQQEVLFVQ